MRFRGSRPSGAPWQQPGRHDGTCASLAGPSGNQFNNQSRLAKARLQPWLASFHPPHPNRQSSTLCTSPTSTCPAEPLPSSCARSSLQLPQHIFPQSDTHSSVSFPLVGHRHFHPTLPPLRRATSSILTAAAMLEARLEQASVLKKVIPPISSPGAAFNANSPPPGGRCDQGPRAGLQL